MTTDYPYLGQGRIIMKTQTETLKPYSISIHFEVLKPFPNNWEDRRWDWEGNKPPTEKDLLEELVAEWKHCTHSNVDTISVEVEKNTYDADGECEWETLHDKTVNATSLKEAIAAAEGKEL